MIRRIQNIDLQFSQVLGELRFHPRLVSILKLFVRIGDGWFWPPIVFGIFLTRSPQEFYAIIAHCLAALGISLAFYWPLKWKVRRLRPFQQLSGVTAEVPPLDRFSFPSGHTMHNLAVGLTVAHYFPPALWPLAIMPVVWGLSRVFFGVHFLSDIIVGAVLGIFSFRLGQWVC